MKQMNIEHDGQAEPFNIEAGYALVITIVVLMGMMALIIPLVMANQRRSIEVNSNLDDVQARFALETALSCKEMDLALCDDPDMKPMIVKNSLLPGWKDMPLTIKHTGADTSTGSIRMANPLPVFLTNCTSYVGLGRDISPSGNSFPLNSSNYVGFNTNVPMRGAMFFMGNEIFYRNNGNTAFRNTRYGGIPQAHKKGEYVYVIVVHNPSEHKIFMSAVRVDGRWFELSGFNYIDPYFYLNISSPTGTYPTITTNSVIEFYTVRMENSASAWNVISTNMKLEVQDEYAKINLNSISKSLATALGFGFIYSGTSLSHPNYPFQTPDTILGLAGSSLSYSDFASKRGSLTTYSEPDAFFIAKSAVYPSPPQVVSTSTTAPIFFHNGDDNANLSTSSGQPIFRHPVNFNTASVYVMSKVFEAMHLPSATGNSSLPLNLALLVEAYRSGDEGANGPIIDYFDGDENAFDGNDTSNTLPEKFYASAEDEFMALMADTSYNLTDNDLQIIRQHVFTYGDQRDVQGLTHVSARICFEASEVRTSVITANVTRNNTVTAMKSISKVTKSEHGHMGTTTRDILLDSSSGWNQTMSTFSGVEWRPAWTSGNNIAPALPNEWVFGLDTPPIPHSLLGYSGNMRFYPTYSTLTTSGNKYLVTEVSGKTTLRTPYKIDFGIHLPGKPWSELIVLNSTNPGEHYILPTGETDAYYETVLVKKNVRWINLQWEERSEGNYSSKNLRDPDLLGENQSPSPDPNLSLLRLTINGNVMDSHVSDESSESNVPSLSSIYHINSSVTPGNHLIYKTINNLENLIGDTDTLRLRFTFPLSKIKNTIEQRSTGANTMYPTVSANLFINPNSNATTPGYNISSANTLTGPVHDPNHPNNFVPYACPQLMRVRVIYEIKPGYEQESNITTYETR